MHERVSALQNVFEIYATYFGSLVKTFDSIGEVGLLQKLTHEIPQMEPYDQSHTHILKESDAVLKIFKIPPQILKLPTWSQLKYTFKQYSNLFGG